MPLPDDAYRHAASEDPVSIRPLDPEAAAHEVDALLDWLESKDLINTERFVGMRVQMRSARFGNLRIRHELAQHGHALDAAANQALKDSELQRARNVWSRRFTEPATEAAARAKQMRFLSARGFSADVVRRVVAGSADD